MPNPQGKELAYKPKVLRDIADQETVRSSLMVEMGHRQCHGSYPNAATQRTTDGLRSRHWGIRPDL